MRPFVQTCPSGEEPNEPTPSPCTPRIIVPATNTKTPTTLQTHNHHSPPACSSRCPPPPVRRQKVPT
ncbi:hypothetical protein LZ30DRAFT_735630 [Colletotrichum cereale]|nr:hypothetical protein LZ30DRAFT_735630 [Colletotrichum cereale]